VFVTLEIAGSLQATRGVQGDKDEGAQFKNTRKERKTME
jgi:hypothetical protein